MVVAPERVVGGLTFAALTAGYDASCGLTAAGVAYCWGDNYVGTLGDGTFDDRAAPTRVSGGLLFRRLGTGGVRLHSVTYGLAENGKNYGWGGIAAPVGNPAEIPGDPGLETVVPGGRVTCGTTEPQVLYCWGRGALGRGLDAAATSPLAVFEGHAVAEVAVGPSHTCLVTTDEETWCWGDNASGQLGHASSPSGWLIPVPVWAPRG